MLSYRYPYFYNNNLDAFYTALLKPFCTEMVIKEGKDLIYIIDRAMFVTKELNDMLLCDKSLPWWLFHVF